MSDPLLFFREGGFAMFAVLGLDLCLLAMVPLALILSIVARSSGKARTAALVVSWLALLLTLVPMCAGVGGYTLGMRNVERAVEMVDPAQRDALQAVGEAEADNNLLFGFGSGCCALIPAILAVMLVPPKREAWQDI